MDETKILRSRNSSNTLRVNKTRFRRFNPDKQPPPGTFYRDELGELRRANSKGWAQPKAGCLFHDSDKKTSFAINVNHGGYRCLSPQCGQHGSMVDFVMRRYGFTFLEAGEYLGAMEDGEPVPIPTVPIPYLACDFAIDGTEYHSEVSDEPRKYAQKIRRFYRDAREQLTALGLEQAESAEAETCWTRMALGLDELREVGIYERA